MGAYIEHCFLACMPAVHLSPAVMVENVKAVGAERSEQV